MGFVSCPQGEVGHVAWCVWGVREREREKRNDLFLVNRGDQRGGGAVTGAAAAAAVEAGGDGKEGEEKLYATFDGMSLGDGCGWGWGSQVECRIIIRVCWPVIWGSP